MAHFISLGIIKVLGESSFMSSDRLYSVQYVLCDLPFWREMHGGRERRVEKEMHDRNLNIEHNYCDFRNQFAVVFLRFFYLRQNPKRKYGH